MKASIFLDGFDWIWIHWPDVAIIGIVLFGGISIALTINNFMHRFKNTEHVCNDMQQRQLPEIRSEIKELRTDVNEVRIEMSEIKAEVNEVRNDVNEVRSEVNEVRTEVNEISTGMTEIRTEMNARFTKVELSLNTIVTYLQAKGNKINLQ